MATRLRYNFLTGTITNLVGTTLTFSSATGLGAITVTNGVNYLPLVINPSTYGSTSSSEIIYITAYTANSNSATVLRGQEGTSALAGTSWPSNTIYAHGALASDFTLVSGMANGDFPTPTASGQILVATSGGIQNPVWSSSFPTISLSGTIAASGIVGVLNNATISGQNVVSNINATQISGGAVQSSVTVSGSQIRGALQNTVTISGVQVVNNISATQISGGALQTTATILGSQVTTAVANATTAVNLAGTINTSQINSGALPSGITISGAQIVNNISATQISGGALQGSVTISGSQVAGTIALATIIAGSAGQALVTNSGGAVAWSDPVTVFNAEYLSNAPVSTAGAPAALTGPTVSGFSTYMIVTKGTVVASGSSGGSFNFNIQPGLFIGNVPPYGTTAWSSASEIYRVNFNGVYNSTTFYDARIATGLDPTQPLISWVQMYLGTVNGTLQSSTVYTVYLRVFGIA